jgi:hypothetical protein
MSKMIKLGLKLCAASAGIIIVTILLGRLLDWYFFNITLGTALRAATVTALAALAAGLILIAVGMLRLKPQPNTMVRWGVVLFALGMAVMILINILLVLLIMMVLLLTNRDTAALETAMFTVFVSGMVMSGPGLALLMVGALQWIIARHRNRGYP